MDEIDFSNVVDIPVAAPPQRKGGITPAHAQAPAAADIDFSQVGPLQTSPTPEPQYRSALGSGVQSGVLGIAGMPADISEAMNYLPELGMRGGLWAREKLGMQVSPEDKAKMESEIAKGRQAYEDFRGMNIPSYVSQKFGGPELKYPTTEELSQAAQPYAEKAFGVGPASEFSLPQEKIAKSAAEMAPQAAFGPLKGLASRVVSGGIGGGASEAAGEYASGSPWELPARLATAIVAPKLTESAIDTAKKVLGATFTSETAAKKALGEALQDYSAESGKQAQLISRTPNLKEAADNFMPRMREFTNKILGTNMNAPEIQEMLTDLGYSTRRQFYEAVKDLPHAQSIETPVLAQLRDQPIFKEAEKNALKNAGSVPEFGLQPPVAGKEGKLTSDARGNWITTGAQQEQAGNLAYYNQVKMELDSIYEQAIRSGDKTTAASARLAKDKLLNELDAIVPEYANARGVASDTFAAASAPEAGAKFFTLTDDHDINQFKKAFGSYTPDQQQAFRVGLMGRLEQELASKNPNLITQRFLRNPQFMEKMEYALGSETANAVRGKVLSENLIQQADKIRSQIASSRAVQEAASPIWKGALSGAGATGLTALAYENQAVLGLLANIGINPNWAIAALASAGAGAAKSFVMSKAEQSVANKIVDLIKTNDPNNYRQISALMKEHPQVYQKLTGPITLMNQVLDEQKDGQNAPQQSTGGRIGRASGGSVLSSDKADRLVKAAESAKKAINSRTEVLLDQPDEKIASALAIAKRHI